MSSRITLCVAAALAALATAACGPDYDRTDIQNPNSSAPGNEIDKNHIQVAEGSLVKVHIVSFDSDGKTMSNDVGSSRVDLQACKLEYSIVSPK